jgi:hypothetical protein
MRHAVKSLLVGLAALAVLGPLAGDEPRPGKGKAAPKPAARRAAWTLDEALAQLELYPRDAYLQYVAMQLARRQGRAEEVGEKLTVQLFGSSGWPKVDLFSLFSGTLAIQESLQLGAMRDPAAPAPRRPTPADRDRLRRAVALARVDSPLPRGVAEAAAAADAGSCAVSMGFPAGVPWPSVLVRSQGEGGSFLKVLVQHQMAEEERGERRQMVNLAGIKGPEVKSHPWKKMLADKKADVSFLSRCVPEDFYLAEFRSPVKLLDFLRTSEQWGAYLYQQGDQDARTRQIRQRVQKQLALQSTDLLRPLYDQVVEETAVTGSDLLFTEGTDVTFLFRFKQPDVFRAQMTRFLADARKARPDARLSRGELLGIAYEHLATPDREVCVYAAYPAANLHVRSNSEAALRRVLEAIRGKDAAGKAVRRLGDADEFRYIRTLLPRGAREEDGLIYLSDPFVRHLVGPRLRLTERRRLLAYNHLCMIGHAAQLYKTEHGRPARSLEELTRAACCPAEFNKGALRCPFGGTYSLAADGLTGVCSHCGTTAFLTPCCETRLTKVSKQEADEYKQFVEEYSQFWKGFFDPIALRIGVTPKRYRVETVILPLIDNSVYTVLAKALGGRAEPLDARPVPKRVLFSMALHFNKEYLIEELKKATGFGALDLNKAVGLHVGAFFTGSLQGGWPGSLPCAALAPADDAVLGLYDPNNAAQHKALVAARQFERFLAKGLGSHASIHIYDVPLTFDAGLEALFGEGLAHAAGRGGEAAVLAPAAMMGVVAPWFFAPTCVALPVQDARVVDQYLAELDRLLAPLARKRFDPSVPVSMDYYKITTRGAVTARSAGLRLGPLRVRAFWARIGDTLYVANQPSVLDDVRAAVRAKGKAKAADADTTAHVLVRLRPRSWDQALAGFRLTWAENSRDACLHNLSPLSSAARAFAAGGQSWDSRPGEALRYAERMYGLTFRCPDGGRYVLAKDGRAVTCTVHGSALEPRQAEEPARDSPLDRLMRGFADLTASLTFREDGLRAVLVVERK